ncbi:hypothetical protein [Phenylobacterium montanum]|uniref:Uncharacterized protein n=1 Tax=Phenylobacterium montanum TaxID=2823693 RepID=A0A975FYC0_9CAUL|nr:hypothetical protein [Caulobacter sp. S6]QUD87454.1 hypothetical protein KCG34_20740 [Caulobacter sp. S6]
MQALLENHKQISAEWVLWLPMLGLWAQAALAALGLNRGKRREPRKPATPKARQPFDPACPPRLITPR